MKTVLKAFVACCYIWLVPTLATIVLGHEPQGEEVMFYIFLAAVTPFVVYFVIWTIRECRRIG